MTTASITGAPGPFFERTTLVRGRPTRIQCVEIASKIFQIERGFASTIHLEDEWFDDVDDPQALIGALASHPALGVDLLTFWQRVPELEPRHPYHLEWQELAVLPVTSYAHWWEHQIKSRVRSQIRKAHKDGLVVREVPFDDELVRGMTAIFNEAPVRQGRPFWHYGKDFATVKAQFSRFVFRETMIGAYHEGSLIGFVMLADAGRFGLTCQIISSLAHRDKSPNGALIAKAVEICAEHGLDHLVYLFWSDDSLAEFKRRCGFERVKAPRYYVPLTWKGRVALECGLHRGWKEAVPAPLKRWLKAWRSAWYRRDAD